MTTSRQTGITKKSATKARAPRAQRNGATRSKSARPSAPVEVTPEERWRMVAVAAYYKSEQRGFAADQAVDDWLEAEKDVDMLLGNR